MPCVCDGAVVRALASHQCGPCSLGFHVDCVCWFSQDPASRVFLPVLRFPAPLKNQPTILYELIVIICAIGSSEMLHFVTRDSNRSFHGF